MSLQPKFQRIAVPALLEKLNINNTPLKYEQLFHELATLPKGQGLIVTLEVPGTPMKKIRDRYVHWIYKRFGPRLFRVAAMSKQGALGIYRLADAPTREYPPLPKRTATSSNSVPRGRKPNAPPKTLNQAVDQHFGNREGA